MLKSPWARHAEDRSPDSISWGEQGGAVLEQLVDALHGGLEKLQQAAAFCRVRAYLSTDNLVAAVASARGNVGICLQGLLRVPILPQYLRDQTLAVSLQFEGTPLSLEPAQQMMLAEMRRSNDLLWNGLILEADCHSRLDALISETFPEGFDIPELRASISDLARGAGEENQQKEHREGHLLMQVSRVLQRRLQVATASSAHSFLSTGSRSLTSEASSFSPATPPKEFVCPISGDLMADPVLLIETGMTFDRASIQEWLNRGNQTCPLTHQRLATGQMISNFSLKALIEAWATEHHVLLPHPSSSVTVTRAPSAVSSGLPAPPARPARSSSMADQAQQRFQNRPMPSAFAPGDVLADAPGTPPQRAVPVSHPAAPHHSSQDDDDQPPRNFMHARGPAPARPAFVSAFGSETMSHGDGSVQAAPQPGWRCPVSAFADQGPDDPAEHSTAAHRSSMQGERCISPNQAHRQFSGHAQPSHQPQPPPSFHSRSTESALPPGNLHSRASPYSASMPANPEYLSHAPGAASVDPAGSGALQARQEELDSYTVPSPIGHRTRLANASHDKVLWEAALAGSSRDVLVAIRKGGSPEWYNSCGKTSLLCAAAAGHPAIVQLLLEQGVNKKAKDLTEDSVMHHAASQARLSVLKTLLSFNDPGVTELLSWQNSTGDTPLHCAASIGSPSCVRTLLDSSGPGATEVKNHLGRTPLHVAAQQGHSAVVLALLQAGAKHTATDDGGLTPLHTACCSGDAGTVSVLIKAGAKRDAWDMLDRQPIDVIGCHRGGEDNQQAQDAIIALLQGGPSSLDAEMEQRKSFCSAASDTTQERMEGDMAGPLPPSTAGSHIMERRPSDTCSADSGTRTRSGAGDTGLQLPSLPMIKKGLDKDDTKAVAVMLLHNRSLTSLDFHGNKPTRRGIKHLCQALEHNRVLTSITLGDCEIDYDGASLIAQTLSSCWLTHLNLWNTRLGNENARPILHALHSNTRLVSLDLGCNELGPEVGNMVAAMLRNNGTLQTLDLRTNRLGKTGIIAIAEGCTQNSSLQELLLNNNGMPMFGLNNAKSIFKARKAAVNLRVKWS
ncbi:hypothetical protein WJX84_006297 [Apatococcus fuscideae]|uniref:U-box domain-containing protein n=1 Tax=Apatococcus fuscideae TaxID=2026836 RepID=A0AAW1SHV9_9CHLO